MSLLCVQAIGIARRKSDGLSLRTSAHLDDMRNSKLILWMLVISATHRLMAEENWVKLFDGRIFPAEHKTGDARFQAKGGPGLLSAGYVVGMEKDGNIVCSQ